MANERWERFIQSCIEDENIKKCKTSKEINDTIFGELKKAYKNKASIASIKAVADDATESVCLRLNIAQTD